MNRESAKKLWPIIKAYGEGEDIEIYDGQSWYLNTHYSSGRSDDIGFNGPPSEYRVKPKPEFRPYTNKEMSELVGKVITHISVTGDAYVVINCIEGCVQLFYDSKTYKYDADSLLKNWTINGKPCGVEEC